MLDVLDITFRAAVYYCDYVVRRSLLIKEPEAKFTREKKDAGNGK